MNTGPHDSTPADANRRDAEWRVQEQALRDERAGTPVAADDARLAEYRLISRALRHPPLDPVPYDFARTVAARATAVAATDDRVERLLLRLLVGVMVAAGASLTAVMLIVAVSLAVELAENDLPVGNRAIAGVQMSSV